MEKVAELIPRAGSAYKNGWRVMSKNFITLFLVLLIIFVASAPLSVTFNISDLKTHNYGIISDFMTDSYGILAIAVIFVQIFGLAYTLFLISPLKYGRKLVYLKAARDDKFEVSDMFDSFKNYLNVVLAALLSGAIIVFGFFFLIIPGIVFACRLVFVPYLVMDKKLDPVKAVEESWRLTKGHGWRILWMGIMAFFISIAGLIVLLFGVFIAGMWISAAFASLYHAVLLEKDEYVVPNGNGN
ncbi:MAG: hypothetical protein RQ743_03215 [Bacteroidales bacterium]|nr:hypothetical protein [Bacteroidales bacterium]